MGQQDREPAEAVASCAAAVALFAPALADLVHEELHVALLDGAMGLLGKTVIQGSGHSVDVPLRALVAEALALDAQGMILAHNHPRGDPAPSSADKAVTRRVAAIVVPLGIRLFDHLVFAGTDWVSFRAMGLL